MRTCWWLAVVVVVASLGLREAEAQRGNMLTQIMSDMMNSVGSVASRIGNGMIKSMGGTPAGTRIPVRQRQAFPPPNALVNEALPAPNAPRPLRQRKERPTRNRINFRRLVDNTMAGIASFMPRLRRRQTRDAELH